MINISKLYCGQGTGDEWIRYSHKDPSGRHRPVVVWNITKACNLRCIHCYSSSGPDKSDGGLTSKEAKTVLEDLAGFGVPVVLFSGGEPLCRQDLFELLGYAGELGLRTVLSTNGTLITADTAKRLKQCGTWYVGISLDGSEKVNDKFRRQKGAFKRAVAGIRNCQDAGIKVGLRLTLMRGNYGQLERIFDFIETEQIKRACFYHLVPAGRGRDISWQLLSNKQTRKAVDTILAGTRQLNQSGGGVEILTVDNHVDGVYVYLKMLEQDSRQAAEVYRLLEQNGGANTSSAVGIGCIGFDGKVYPNQFWGHYELGDVRKRNFSKIWTDESRPLLKALRNRSRHIKGRCRVCKFFSVCGGGSRVRAESYFNDLWAPEPACYLTDEQIGLDKEKQKDLAEAGQIFRMPK